MRRPDRFLQPSPDAVDLGNLVGRDPRTLTAVDWTAWNADLPVGIKAIRTKCMDCAHTALEVRKCVVISFPLWSFRMGSVPRHYRVPETETPVDAANDSVFDDA